MGPSGIGGPIRWTPETFPLAETGPPIYKSLPPDHSRTPRDVRYLIRDSEQLSGYYILISLQPYRHQTLTVLTLRVRETRRHDRDDSRAITNSGIWIPMLAPTCSSMISSDEPRCRGLNQSRIQFPLSIGTLLARDSIVGIPIPCSVSLPASHFTCTIMHDPVINHLIKLSSL